jgi:hypothetical protein
MKTLFTTLAVAGALVLAAGSANAATQAQCQAYAQQTAQAYAPPGGGALAGGVIGAIAGGLIGGANNNNAAIPGAIIGGAGGAIVGGAATQAKYNQIYQQAYWQCMNGGVVTPQPIYQPQPQPGQVFPAPGAQAGVYQSLNVRVCPAATAQCPAIGTIQPGSFVPVNGCTSANPGQGWCQVGIPAGWGWASAKYLYF